jgi:signal peptidase
MEPEIPVGSVIYVKAAAPEEIGEGEIIAFMRNSSVITHRVEENRFVEGEFITKGDANSKEDVMPVDYDSLIGKVTCHIPVLGILLSVLASGVGKLYAGAFAACGFMFLMLAEKIRERQEG